MYSLETLPNKIKLLLAPQAGTAAVTVLVLVKIGSRYEAPKINGISHFIEHLLFKGTKKRPTSLDVTKELDGVGADFNAFTAKDHTGYYIKVGQEKLELALDVISDILFNPQFAATEIEKERQVIMEEINMYEDNPLMFIGSLLEETIFAGHPLGSLISGAKENIAKISRADIVRYFKNNYGDGNVLVAVGGNFSVARTKKLIQRYFKRPAVSGKKSALKKFQLKQNEPRLKIKNKKTEQAHLALGYPALKITDPKLYPLLLLSVILGGNMSSRLFLEVREKLGLAYYIRSGVDAFEDTGCLAVSAGVDKSRLGLAIKTILRELQKLTVEDVTAEELIKAKEHIRGKMILRLEDSAQLVEWLALQQLLKNSTESWAEQWKKIKRVSANDIKQIAKEVIKRRRLSLAVIGPDLKKAELLKLI